MHVERFKNNTIYIFFSHTYNHVYPTFYYCLYVIFNTKCQKPIHCRNTNMHLKETQTIIGNMLIKIKSVNQAAKYGFGPVFLLLITNWDAVYR